MLMHAGHRAAARLADLVRALPPTNLKFFRYQGLRRSIARTWLSIGDGNLSPIILSADSDKAHRSVSLVIPNVVSVDAWMICVSPALL